MVYLVDIIHVKNYDVYSEGTEISFFKDIILNGIILIQQKN